MLELVHTHICVQIRTAISSINATARVIVPDSTRYPTWQELMDVARDKSHDHRECGVCEDELDDGKCLMLQYIVMMSKLDCVEPTHARM